MRKKIEGYHQGYTPNREWLKRIARAEASQSYDMNIRDDVDKAWRKVWERRGMEAPYVERYTLDPDIIVKWGEV